MSDRIRVACVQLTSRQDKAANLSRAEALVARAASTGADVVVLPEKWNLVGSADDYRAAAEPLEGGPSTDAMSRWARTLGVTLVGGSITERRDGREKLSNTSCVFDPEAELVTVPAHFTTPTGRDHWHVLLRARAIENQYYVAAAGQVGETIPGKPAYGRSLVVDPWGTVLAQAPDEETVIVAEVDRARLRDIRAKLPSLANRQAGAYRWPTRT